jgi:predicted  nucleic acid-binding Zn-ribbon protein
MSQENPYNPASTGGQPSKNPNQGTPLTPPTPPTPPSLSSPPPAGQPKRRSNNWIYATIIALLLATNIYLFLNRREMQSQNTELAVGKASADSSYAAVNTEYQAALARLDLLVSENEQMDSLINGQNSEVSQLRSRIEELLNKERRTADDYSKAQRLVKQLNARVSTYEKRIADLEGQNKTLSEQAAIIAEERDEVLEQKAGLEEKVKLGSVLHASNIRMVPIDLRRSGRKEKETTRARRVDILRILFDIDENRIATAGSKDLYLRITAPGGSLVSNPGVGSGATTAATGERIDYTLQKPINLRQGERVSDVSVDWKQDGDYEKGTYAIEIYNEGYKIGGGSVTLR